ncbi:MAG: cohesin domain-containing protein [Candidatus Zixiibacteriota bacterium]
MTGWLAGGLPVALLLLLPLLLVAWPAQAQTPSILDTLRIINATAAVGDTFDVDVYLRNVDSLGSFTFRIVYNTALIEPLTDTSAVGDTVKIELQALRGATIWENFGASFGGAGVITFVAVNWDIGVDAFMPGAGATARMQFRVLPTATAQVTTIDFENDPNYPAAYNTITDAWASVFKRPVLTNGSVTITEGGGPGPGNDPPSIPVLPSPLSVNQGDLITFSVSATDPDGDSLRLRAFNLPTGAQFTPANPVYGKPIATGTFRWTPNFSQSGPYVVSFEATDSAGLVGTIRNVTIDVTEVARDMLFTTSVAGQDPQGGVPGATGVVIPVDLTTVQTVYGVQFDFVYDPTVFTPTMLQPTDKLTGFTVYDNLGVTPGRLRVVTFSLVGDPVGAGTSNVLFNVIGNISGDAAPGAYDIKFENSWESINPDPNVASVQLASTDGAVYVDFAGDVNLDGRVDVADVVAVVGYILGDFTFTGRQFGAGDVNHDMYLDVFDLVTIVNTIFGTQPLALAAAVTPARLSLTYDASDGPHGAYRLAASAPTDIAGAQIEFEYDPKQVTLSSPQSLSAASGYLLRHRNDGRGHLIALMVYMPSSGTSRIQPGESEILRIPLASGAGDRPSLYISNAKLADPKAGRIEVTGIEPLPRDFVLEQNYPNPFNAATTISFSLRGSAGTVATRLEVFNVLGQHLATLIDEPMEPGNYSRVWDGTSESGQAVASGLYFYRLTTGNHTETKKMVLLK